MKKIILKRNEEGQPVNKASINYDETHSFWFFYDDKLGIYFMIDGLGRFSTGKAQETERFMKDRFKMGDKFSYYINEFTGFPDIYFNVLNIEIPVNNKINGHKTTIRKHTNHKIIHKSNKK